MGSTPGMEQPEEHHRSSPGPASSAASCTLGGRPTWRHRLTRRGRTKGAVRVVAPPADAPCPRRTGTATPPPSDSTPSRPPAASTGGRRSGTPAPVAAAAAGTRLPPGRPTAAAGGREERQGGGGGFGAGRGGGHRAAHPAAVAPASSVGLCRRGGHGRRQPPAREQGSAGTAGEAQRSTPHHTPQGGLAQARRRQPRAARASRLHDRHAVARGRSRSFRPRQRGATRATGAIGAPWHVWRGGAASRWVAAGTPPARVCGVCTPGLWAGGGCHAVTLRGGRSTVRHSVDEGLISGIFVQVHEQVCDLSLQLVHEKSTRCCTIGMRRYTSA